MKKYFLFIFMVSALQSAGINIGIKNNANVNIALGEKLYKSRCAKCHGNDGEVIAYGVSRKLKDLSGEQISSAMIAYANNTDYGGRFKNIMKPFAVSTSYKDIADIIAYLKGEGELAPENDPTKPTKQGVYIE